MVTIIELLEDLCGRLQWADSATVLNAIGEIKRLSAENEMQANKIQELQADVKRQQNNMIKLARAKDPVVHGEWIEAETMEEQMKSKVICSVCRMPQYALELTVEAIYFRNPKTKFCPNCGAKMKGAER